MPDATFRFERPGDAEGIRQLLAQAFPSDAESRLVEALRDSRNLIISIVALIDDAIVGHVAFSPVRIEERTPGLGLAPLAVVPEWRRRGFASKLVRLGLDAARSSAIGFVVVLGEPDFYSRFGFQPAARWNLKDDYEGGEAFQAIELRPGIIPPLGGHVRYGEEFAGF